METEEGGRERRLLALAGDHWPETPREAAGTGLRSLGDEGGLMEAILGGMLSEGSQEAESLVIEEWPFSSLDSSEAGSSSTLSLAAPNAPSPTGSSLSLAAPSPTGSSLDSSEAGSSSTLSLAAPSAPSPTGSSLSPVEPSAPSPTGSSLSLAAPLEAAPGPSTSAAPSAPSPPPGPSSLPDSPRPTAPPLPSTVPRRVDKRRRRAADWRRRSMRRLVRLSLREAAARSAAVSHPVPPPPSHPVPPPLDTSPQLPSYLEEVGVGDMGERLLGEWPHSASSMLACLATTLGIFNVSRFAILSVQYGANFIVQFLVMSLILGIPLFTFHVSLGQLLGAGVMDMWRISPIFQGIGIGLIISQALIGIYSIVGVSWMFVYFRDSFITKQDTYRWSQPYDDFAGHLWKSNTTSVKLEETVADYFSAVVLQRSNNETPANSPGHLKFQVTFNLAVVWMVVFISLSKGLKSYGKVVFLFSLVPAFGMLVLCTKLLGLTPQGSRINISFLQTDWNEFFLNSKSWSAAMSESFYTWGLLGASAMQMASHNPPKHRLHRDTSFVVCVTFFVLVMAAFLANTCSQILSSNGFIYIPSSFERMSTYGFLHPSRSPLPSSLASIPPRWLSRSVLVAGERVAKPGVNGRQQSGYQALRLATELVPATLAVLGPGRLSPFWSVLFYFVLILFGIAQQLAIMHCVITGIMAIKVKTMKSWETTITFFTCFCGFILGLPMATELGIFVVYFLDYTVGGGWWLMLLYLAELVAVFMVRGRPYSGEAVVSALFAKAGRFLQEWAAPLLSFTWNVILPVLLMVLCISVFKAGNYREMFRLNGILAYDYWPPWSRQLGCLLQLLPLLLIPFIGIVQSCRYLSGGPPDIFDRIQLLYRPPEEEISADLEPHLATTDTELNSGSAPVSTIEDPPPKYTPPPSYSTATGARIAKLMRQSFRRSMRRITSVLGSGGGGGGGTTEPEPPPPDYATVLVEIHQSLNASAASTTGGDGATTTPDSAPPTTSAFSVNEVAAIFRNSFRRAMSSSSQRLVDSASPINRDSLIEDKRID